MSALIGLLGMVILLGIGYALSNNRNSIRLRTVLGAFLIQFLIGGIVLFVPAGKAVLGTLSIGVQNIINYSNDGISFMLGGLVSDKMYELFGGLGFVFAFRVLPIIIFFSSLIAVLYYLKIMQVVIKTIGGALRIVLGTSRTESLSAAANIFVGQTEAPLVVRPYIPRMTQSELFAIMCGGLASIAGSVMAGYAQMGVELRYLLAASFMAAPGGLLFAKLLHPEVDVPDDGEIKEADGEDSPANVFDAAAGGAAQGLKLAANVGAMLLAFISLIALVNGITGGICGWFGYENVTLQQVFGYLFSPLSWAIGVPWSEAVQAGSFIGQKVILNEFVAYADFVQVKETLTPRTQVIVTFALCGFANLSSIAILLGGLGGMAPGRRGDIARMGLKAVLAASLSNLLSAAMAGFFLSLST
ncbi:MAG: NupC/NupG family nucleoside CNT transporter [Verrucomicrobia bacterium]|nr:MAG: NupC/NupG family nucleoside CNT transporter [Verrucomicrobiota bacterium]